MKDDYIKIRIDKKLKENLIKKCDLIPMSKVIIKLIEGYIKND